MSLSSAHAEAADLAVQGTNTSSITSKRSAERLGYFEHCLVHGATSGDSPLLLEHVVPRPVRRSPVINRAYFMRTDGIRRIIEKWLEDCEALGIPECAIVNLGCGFDPTFFRLQAIRREKAQRGVGSPTLLRYVDIDYPALIVEKLYMARTNSELAALLPTDARVEDVGQLVSDAYSCLGVDLRQLDQLAHALQLAGVTPEANMPTLIISEVVLAYLSPGESDGILRFFSRYPRATMYAHFERTMTSLKTLRVYRSIEDQAARFQRLGWNEGHIFNMNLFENKVVLADASLRRRIAILEPFDEFDEMHWIGTYYFMGIATTPAMDPLVDPMPNVVKALGLSLAVQTLPPSPGCYTTWSPSSSSSSSSLATTTTTTPAPSPQSGRALWTSSPPLGSVQIRRKGHSLCILGDHAYIFGGFGDDITSSDSNQINGSTEQEATFQARSQQGRLSSMIVYNFITGAHEVVRSMDEGSGSHNNLASISNGSSFTEWPAARMYHAAVESLDGTSFYIYGGRDGPTKVHNDVWQYSAEEGWSQLWRAKSVSEGGFDSAYPKGLYKHTLSMMTIAGREMMVLIGGRNSQGEANDQIWAFDLVDSQWSQFKWRQGVSPSLSSSPSASPKSSSPLPSFSSNHRWQGLFSHSATVVTDKNGEQSLLVYGGINGKGERVLNKLWRVTLSVEEETYACWADATLVPLHHADMPGMENDDGNTLLAPPLDSSNSHDRIFSYWSPKPRFSHVGLPVGDNRVWLLGGVSDPALLQWQETVVEIQLAEDGASASYRELEPSSFKEQVMVNHAVAIDRARNRIIGVGGGGVCFGFGGWFDSESWGIVLDGSG
ncbi:Leucine carboxyl methyltransferase 2 [Actinomortierella wolfii]|nr:Leucine carboxyl methyltransferase 2 [Actinomortierella wolfii]